MATTSKGFDDLLKIQTRQHNNQFFAIFFFKLPVTVVLPIQTLKNSNNSVKLVSKVVIKLQTTRHRVLQQLSDQSVRSQNAEGREFDSYLVLGNFSDLSDGRFPCLLNHQRNSILE